MDKHLYETVTNKMNKEEKKYVLEKKIEQILEVAENIRRLAEIEADEILNNAKKKASMLNSGIAIDEIINENGFSKPLKKIDLTAKLNEKKPGSKWRLFKRCVSNNSRT